MEKLKIILTWMGSILVFCSILLNVYLLGFVYMDRQLMDSQAKYIVYRDSTQLIIMDKMIQKYYGSSK